MSNPLNVNQSTNAQIDYNKLFQQFKQDPMRYLTGLNIPQSMNSPQQIVQFLADNNRIPTHLKGYVNSLLGR